MFSGKLIAEYTLVASSSDKASLTMYNALLNLDNFIPTGDSYHGSPIFVYQNVNLILSKMKGIFLTDLDEFFAPQSYIFLSKHRSESGSPTLTAHFTGNFSDNVVYGGNPREIAWTDPMLLKAYFTRLWSQRENLSKYDIILEATHHGPTSLSRPCMFVEIGSKDQEWENNETADLVVRVLLEAISNQTPAEKVGLGIGGPHYSRKFTKLILSDGLSLAGYIPKHSLTNTDDDIILQALEKTVEKIDYAFVDWKGLGSEKQRIIELLEKYELQIQRI